MWNTLQLFFIISLPKSRYLGVSLASSQKFSRKSVKVSSKFVLFTGGDPEGVLGEGGDVVCEVLLGGEDAPILDEVVDNILGSDTDEFARIQNWFDTGILY